MARRIYLDYASTTPVGRQVLKAMLPYMSKYFGNPSALSKEGVEAKKAVQDARKKIAQILNIRSEEIVFTGSGTEADNLAVRGVYEYALKNVQKKSKNFKDHNTKPHIITTSIEHPGILEICKKLEHDGCEVSYIDPEENGIVDPKKVQAALKPNTILVSVMYANNEIGTIQPLREISRVIQEFKQAQKNNSHDTTINQYPYFHTDASQAGNYLDLSFQKLGVDMMTLDAGKIYGPKGVGLLAVRRYVELAPLLYGGGQESGKRSSTENVAGIVGMSEALALAQDSKTKEKEVARLRKLQEYFIENVIKEIPSVFINGDIEKRLPNNVNICVPGIDAEFAVIQLDSKGIACSAASACLNLSEDTYSYVIAVLEKAKKDTQKTCRSSSLRFTFGRDTMKKDLELTIRQLATIIIKQ